MSNIHAFDDYKGNSFREYPKGYLISVAICFLLIIIVFITSVVTHKVQKRINSIIPSFEQAIEEGRYSDAVKIYRDIQDEVLSVKPGENKRVEKQDLLMEQMEEIVENKFAIIADDMLVNRYELNGSDVKFFSEMKELINSCVGDWSTKLCEGFLFGKYEKPDIVYVFEQLKQVDALEYSVEPLRNELDNMEKERGSCTLAENHYLKQEYVESVLEYKKVYEKTSGFVKDFSNQRITDIKKEMYNVTIERGEHMLERYQYYSAEKLFSDLSVIFPDDKRINNDLLQATDKTTPVEAYNGNIEVICVKQLIADNEVAFKDNKEKESSTNHDLYLTCSEFSNMLNQLHEKNYILIDPEMMCDIPDNLTLLPKTLLVPQGKKPLILIIENLDYSEKNIPNGGCSKLLLNDKKQVCGQYVDKSGNLVVNRTAEAIGILDEFIEKNPDFSYNGKKGVISLCGYESCFGYVISEDEIDDRNSALKSNGKQTISYSEADIEKNVEDVKQIVDVLKDTGWKFASSTYGNINAKVADLNEIKTDTDKWINQIGSVVGNTYMLVYPGGNFINGKDEKAQYLKNNGFKVFFGVGYNAYYIFGDNYLYYDRAVINGEMLRQQNFSRLFDVEKVYDSDRPQALRKSASSKK